MALSWLLLIFAKDEAVVRCQLSNLSDGGGEACSVLGKLNSPCGHLRARKDSMSVGAGTAGAAPRQCGPLWGGSRPRALEGLVQFLPLKHTCV